MSGRGVPSLPTRLGPCSWPQLPGQQAVRIIAPKKTAKWVKGGGGSVDVVTNCDGSQA